METFSSFNAYIQKAIIENWDQDALTDYQGITLQFHDVARKIDCSISGYTNLWSCGCPHPA